MIELKKSGDAGANEALEAIKFKIEKKMPGGLTNVKVQAGHNGVDHIGITVSASWPDPEARGGKSRVKRERSA